MPAIGEIRVDIEIGKGETFSKYIWHACELCGKERWVQLRHKNPMHLICRSCNIKLCLGKGLVGSRNPMWKGGRYKDSAGYIVVRIYPDDFFYSMADHKGYILEHRLIMAKHLSRCLLPWEIIHHKNGIKDDNRLENLELLPHGRFHLIDMKTKSRITELEKQVILLED